ncbi:MAG: SPFH domain-containing protein [Muribaculaceae bacterium]|nr:SPFH domain-containing protein [Muribaculaceae bacterium]
MNYANQEFEYKGLIINGFMMIFFTFILIPILLLCCIITGGEDNLWISVGCSLILFILFILGCVGYFVQEPNEARVMVFFGKYVGTCHKVGYFWANPFVNRKKISLRIRNMDIDPIKVNDKVGNPVLIGMVLVWKVCDTYRVVFDLDAASLSTAQGASINNAALTNFVRIQSDAALREVTTQFAYDPQPGHPDELTLRDGGEAINNLLEHKINERLAMAGIEVVEARLNYLAYAPEIAAVMLRRQQAAAIISAREKIVEGAVSMVEMALKRLDESESVKLDASQRAAMVSNLLVVLCGDEPVSPMVNTGA